MQKQCEQCGKILKVPDEKLPEGKLILATCPSCGNKVKLLKKAKPEKPAFDFEEEIAKEQAAVANSNIGSENKPPQIEPAYDFSPDSFEDEDDDKNKDPFSFIEEEGEMAMICIQDGKIAKEIGHILEYMEYSIFYPKNNHESLRELRMHAEFSLIIVDELFDCEDIRNNAVIRYIKRLPMRERREVFVALISPSRRTLDKKDAFAHSVNIIINQNHTIRFEDFIKKGLTESENFYKLFKETMKAGLRF